MHLILSYISHTHTPSLSRSLSLTHTVRSDTGRVCLCVRALYQPSAGSCERLPQAPNCLQSAIACVCVWEQARAHTHVCIYVYMYICKYIYISQYGTGLARRSLVTAHTHTRSQTL